MNVIISARFFCDLLEKPSWVDLFNRCTEIDPEVFSDRQAEERWWAGGTVQAFAHARIIRRPDGSVSLASTTEKGALALGEAAHQLGVYVIRTQVSV
jgi:hypothetical protein